MTTRLRYLFLAASLSLARFLKKRRASFVSSLIGRGDGLLGILGIPQLRLDCREDGLPLAMIEDGFGGVPSI